MLASAARAARPSACSWLLKMAHLRRWLKAAAENSAGMYSQRLWRYSRPSGWRWLA